MPIDVQTTDSSWPALIGGTKDMSPEQKQFALEMRRWMKANPDAAKVVMSNLMQQSGYGKWSWLQQVPAVGNGMRAWAANKNGLGFLYLSGHDPKAPGTRKNQKSRFYYQDPGVRSFWNDLVYEKTTGHSPMTSDASAGLEKLRARILSDPQLKKTVLDNLKERGKDKIEAALDALPEEKRFMWDNRDNPKPLARIARKRYPIDLKAKFENTLLDEAGLKPTLVSSDMGGYAMRSPLEKYSRHDPDTGFRMRGTGETDMKEKDLIKQAYVMGYQYALAKQAGFLDDLKDVWGQNSKPEDIQRMAIGTVGGMGAGALAGGPGRRVPGALWGGLGGLILSNPQLFKGLLSAGWNNLAKYLSRETNG